MDHHCRHHHQHHTLHCRHHPYRHYHHQHLCLGITIMAILFHLHISIAITIITATIISNVSTLPPQSSLSLPSWQSLQPLHHHRQHPRFTNIIIISSTTPSITTALLPCLYLHHHHHQHLHHHHHLHHHQHFPVTISTTILVLIITIITSTITIVLITSPKFWKQPCPIPKPIHFSSHPAKDFWLLSHTKLPAIPNTSTERWFL